MIAATVDIPVPPIPAMIIFCISLRFGCGLFNLLKLLGSSGNIVLEGSDLLLEVTPMKLGQNPFLHE